MRKLILVLLLAGQSFAATPVYLRDALSAIQQSSDIVFRSAGGTRGAAATTAITNTIAATLTGHYWPISTASYIITKTAAGTKTIWLSDPIATISGPIAGVITPNLWGVESSTSANATFRYQVLRWRKACGCIDVSVAMSSDSGMAEFTASSVKTAPTVTPASGVTFVAGDRIVIVIYNDDVGGETASSRTITLNYNGASAGVSGDTYINFTETITFSADSNNQPARSVNQ